MIAGLISQDAWKSGAKKERCGGTLAPVLGEYGVTFRVMHGYGSATAVNDVAMQTEHMEQPLRVLYVGDYDPSGMHISVVDLPDRLYRYYGNVELVRVALTLEQCEGLPGFPACDKRPNPKTGKGETALQMVR